MPSSLPMSCFRRTIDITGPYVQFLKVDMPAACLLQPAQQQSRAECLLTFCQREADATLPSPPAEQNGGQDPFRSPHAAAHCSGSPAGKAVQPLMQAAEGLDFRLCFLAIKAATAQRSAHQPS